MFLLPMMMTIQQYLRGKEPVSPMTSEPPGHQELPLVLAVDEGGAGVAVAGRDHAGQVRHPPALVVADDRARDAVVPQVMVAPGDDHTVSGVHTTGVATINSFLG